MVNVVIFNDAISAAILLPWISQGDYSLINLKLMVLSRFLAATNMATEMSTTELKIENLMNEIKFMD